MTDGALDFNIDTSKLLGVGGFGAVFSIDCKLIPEIQTKN